MEIAGKVVQRPMPPECWDLDLRLADMDKHGIEMQAVCATVHTFFYDEEPELGAACAGLQNDEIAAVVAAIPIASWLSPPCRCRIRNGRRTS